MIHTHFSNGILEIQLSDRDSRNAMSLGMCKAILSAIDDTAPASLLVSSRGPIFCAGGNLKDYAALQKAEDGVEINTQIRRSLETLYNLPLPKAALVNGKCFGGGVEFLSCFDRVVATPSSLFGLWQRKNGLSFGWGGRRRLEDRLGAAALREWYFSVSLKTSYQARAMGLIQEVGLTKTLERSLKAWLMTAQSYRVETLALYKDRELTESEVFKKLWWNEDHKKSLKPFVSQPS